MISMVVAVITIISFVVVYRINDYLNKKQLKK